MSTAVYQLGQFAVPDAARAAFLDRLQATQTLLRAQPGVIDAKVLAQPSAAGTTRILTLAAWRDEAAVEAARAQVQAAHQAEGFDLAAFRARLGIQAEMSTWRDASA